MFKKNDNNIYDSGLGFAFKNHAKISKFTVVTGWELNSQLYW